MTITNEDLPVVSEADVLAAFPHFIQDSDSAPVRDAIVAFLTEIFQEYQTRAEYASAQSSVLTATDIYLEGLGADRLISKQSGEDQESYRTRILTVPQLVTPSAILAAVKALIAPYTNSEPQYFEASLDRWFIDDTAHYSFIGASPTYTDRLFPDDIGINGVARSNSDVGGAWVFPDHLGRYFVLRIPSLTGTDDEHAFISVGSGSFINNGTNPSGSETDGTVATFVYSDRLTSQDLYSLIVSAVERIKGHSIRWAAIVDTRL